MFTSATDTLGSANASFFRRVTTTTRLHIGLLIKSLTMRPPTFPVAPSTITEYCAVTPALAWPPITDYHPATCSATTRQHPRRGVLRIRSQRHAGTTND